MGFEVFVVRPSATVGTIRNSAQEALILCRQWEADGVNQVGVRDALGRPMTVEDLAALAARESRS